MLYDLLGLFFLFAVYVAVGKWLWSIGFFHKDWLPHQSSTCALEGNGKDKKRKRNSREVSGSLTHLEEKEK